LTIGQDNYLEPTTSILKLFGFILKKQTNSRKEKKLFNLIKPNKCEWHVSLLVKHLKISRVEGRWKMINEISDGNGQI